MPMSVNIAHYHILLHHFRNVDIYAPKCDMLAETHKSKILRLSLQETFFFLPYFTYSGVLQT